MTNVIKLSDKSYVHLDQVPDLMRLYAQIGCDNDDCILERANICADEIESAESTRIRNRAKPIRIIEVRRAFKECAQQLPTHWNKPINDGFVESVKLFFKMALQAGYTESDKLHSDLECSSSPMDFQVISDNARDARISGDKKRHLGLMFRTLRREYAILEQECSTPLTQFPRGVGQKLQR